MRAFLESLLHPWITVIKVIWMNFSIIIVASGTEMTCDTVSYEVCITEILVLATLTIRQIFTTLGSLFIEYYWF